MQLKCIFLQEISGKWGGEGGVVVPRSHIERAELLPTQFFHCLNYCEFLV